MKGYDRCLLELSHMKAIHIFYTQIAEILIYRAFHNVLRDYKHL